MPRLGMNALPLHSSEVHVWSASLRLGDELVQTLRRELAADEVERAERMHTPDLARRFVVGRAVLRRLLAVYVPNDVIEHGTPLPLTYGARGKPSLAPAIAARASISFNLAHANDLAVYAIAGGRSVGIDIEATGRGHGDFPLVAPKPLADVEIEAIAKKVFSPRECETLAALPATQRRQAFFHIWARKEAYIKAHGQGFGYPTRSFSVSHRDDDDALIADDTDGDARRAWRVVGLPAPAGYAMALAAEGRDWSVGRFDASTVL